MRQILLRVLAGATLVLALAGFAATPAQAAAGDVTVSSPCLEVAWGSWVKWTVTNHTAADIEAATITDDAADWYLRSFTIPAGGSVVRTTMSGYSVEVKVGVVVVASASVSPDAVRECGTTPNSFNLIIDCRPSPYQVTLRIKNGTDQARPYKLTKQRGEELTGTALPGNTYITEDWVKPTDRWKLEIVGYRYVRVVNEPPLCNVPSPVPTATTNAPSPAPTATAPAPTRTVAPPVGATVGPDPTLAPASSSSGLNSGNGVLVVGLAGLLVGSVLGTAASFRLRRWRTE
ncbi:hypothetical protein [Micromonospora chersina]|uniref:hypothetical protein n=1 Tax=Micromonospora chersina TaxID=47854 RepID=UPI0033D35812